MLEDAKVCPIFSNPSQETAGYADIHISRVILALLGGCMCWVCIVWVIASAGRLQDTQ